MPINYCILELVIDGKKVDEVKCFGNNNIENTKSELKKVWCIDDKTDFQMWLVYRPDIKELSK